MAWFGLTVEEVLRVWNMRGEDFNSPPNGGVNNYATVIGNALTRAEQQVLSQLPERVVTLLSQVDGEYLTREADSGQTTMTTTHTTSNSAKLLLWKFSEGEWVIGQLKKTSDYRTTAFTVNGRTITLTTAAAEGDICVASYPVNLLNNCNSLHSPLLDFAAVELLTPRYPGFREDYQRRVELSKQWFAMIRAGETMLPELAKLDLVDEAEVDGGGMICTWRNPS